MNIKQRKRLERFEETGSDRINGHVPKDAPDIFFMIIVIAIFLFLVVGFSELIAYLRGE